MTDHIRPYIGRPLDSAPAMKQARAIRTRELIIAAAAQHFDTYGYGDATVNAILAASNLTKGAIYFHFPSKESIAQQLTADWIYTVTELVTDAAGTHLTATEQLATIFTALAQGVATDTNLRAGMKLTLEPTVDNADAFARWVDAISDIVDTAITTGEIPDTPTAHRLAWNLCAGTVGAAHASAFLREDIDLATRIGDTVAAHITAVSA
ncbi:UNVERIFIED_ORG: AcrR family transcriptional regulator [Rhodococcus erythropolis]